MHASEPQTHPKPKLFTLPNLAAAFLLLMGVVIAYSPRLAPTLWGQGNSAADSLTYVADLDYWQRTDRETMVRAKTRFDLDADLNSIPLTLGDWTGEDVPETNQEVIILLNPEQYIQRLYRNSQGHYMWLSIIGGRSSQPFHAPDICYDVDGWQYALSSKAIPLTEGGDLHGLWMEAHKQLPGAETDVEHIVFYFYLFPNRARELKDGIVLVKLTSGRYGSAEDTLALHADFIQHLFDHAARPGS